MMIHQDRSHSLHWRFVTITSIIFQNANAADVNGLITMQDTDTGTNWDSDSKPDVYIVLYKQDCIQVGCIPPAR